LNKFNLIGTLTSLQLSQQQHQNKITFVAKVAIINKLPPTRRLGNFQDEQVKLAVMGEIVDEIILLLREEIRGIPFKQLISRDFPNRISCVESKTHNNTSPQGENYLVLVERKERRWV
jgi:hypothetical protein